MDVGVLWWGVVGLWLVCRDGGTELKVEMTIRGCSLPGRSEVGDKKHAGDMSWEPSRDFVD